MPIATGINHVAVLTTDMARTVRFYEEAFGAVTIDETVATPGHPWMKVVQLGGNAALNVFEVAADTIVGERGRIGARGAVDHFGIGVDSITTLEAVKERLVAAGAQEVGEIRPLGKEWSLFFRDPDGLELEVCSPRSD